MPVDLVLAAVSAAVGGTAVQFARVRLDRRGLRAQARADAYRMLRALLRRYPGGPPALSPVPSDSAAQEAFLDDLARLTRTVAGGWPGDGLAYTLERLMDGLARLRDYDNRASRPAFERLLREVDAAGYAFSWKVLNAADHGVAQSRPRLFVIGARKGQPVPAHPDPTHGGRWERRATGHHEHPHVTTGEALAGLVCDPEPGEEVGGRFGHLLPGVPPGGNYLHYTEERGHPDPQFAWRSRFWWFLLKLDPDRPAPTIQAQPGPYVGPFHWENRRLRVGEVKRLFGFPDGFDLVGRRSSVQAQLGNCVPPPLAARVASALSP